MVSSLPLYKHDNYYSRTADSGNRAWQSPAHGRLNWNWEKHSERNGIYFAFIDSSEKPNNVLYNTLVLRLLTVQRVYYVLTRRDVAGRCDDCAWCDALVFIFREFCTFFTRSNTRARLIRSRLNAHFNDADKFIRSNDLERFWKIIPYGWQRVGTRLIVRGFTSIVV